LSPTEITRPHDWRQMTVIPMKLVKTLKGEVLLIDPEKVVQSSIGCWACNMGFDEGQDVNCPGQDLFDGEQISPGH
jgi:hypothetical protein